MKMDIVAASMALSQSNLSDQVGMALMNLAKDQMEVSGENLVKSMKSMELSVNPNVGGQIDISI